MCLLRLEFVLRFLCSVKIFLNIFAYQTPKVKPPGKESRPIFRLLHRQSLINPLNKDPDYKRPGPSPLFSQYKLFHMLNKMADAIERERGKAVLECMEDALSLYR